VDAFDSHVETSVSRTLAEMLVLYNSYF
jgi:hypothetical protein